MGKETQWQSKILTRVRGEGGYGRKWATQYSVGVPDLITATQRGVLFIECKYEGDWNKATSRKIKFSEKQKEQAWLINESMEAQQCIGLVIAHSPAFFHGVSKVRLIPVRVPPVGTDLLLTIGINAGYAWNRTEPPSLMTYLQDWSKQDD
jgi:hypothetical protein